MIIKHFTRFNVLIKDIPSEESFLNLSHEFSEWLFFIGFWQNINKKLGTNFDQYEEDEVSKSDLKMIYEEFLVAKAEVISTEVNIISFKTGYNITENKEIRISIIKEEIISEFEKVIEFLKMAIQEDYKIECSL